jgi:membrane-associated protease RseP (regulator of RpoE activity)
MEARTAKIVLVTLAVTLLLGLGFLFSAAAGFVLGRVTAPRADLPSDRLRVFPTPEAPFARQRMAVEILEVAPGSPAELAGLLPGDRILSVDGAPLGMQHDLAELIQSFSPGDRVVLEVHRQGEADALRVRVELGENPDRPGVPYLGIRYEWIPPMLPPDPLLPPSGGGLPGWASR